MEIDKDEDQIIWHTEGLPFPISEDLVMKSAAGWYIGQVCKDPDIGGAIVPYDRESIYGTKEEARKWLASGRWPITF